MKTIVSALFFFLISLIINAQEANVLYTFNSGNDTTFSISCGETGTDNWKVSASMCNFYTPLTTLPENSVDRNTRLQAQFHSGSQMDEDDLITIFFYVNGNTQKTFSINGRSNQTLYQIDEVLNIPAGANFRFRIAMISNKSGEFWQLNDGELTLTTKILKTPKSNEVAPSTGILKIIRERNIAKLNWYANSGNEINYYKIERSKNGNNFELVGFVKQIDSTEPMVPYSIIDATFYQPQTWYRILKVDFNGNEIPLGETVAVKF
jgi:hypothetical protein